MYISVSTLINLTLTNIALPISLCDILLLPIPNIVLILEFINYIYYYSAYFYRT